jgi:bifunctional non-homologous end joining protein LigD
MRARFVIHEHHATNLHFDLRLEIGGVLISWAVPKGLSLNPDENRLAIRVSDHKISYFNFEGTRRKGLYGAGEVCIWDKGEFEMNLTNPDYFEKVPHVITFYGKKISGKFLLCKWNNSRDRWSIIKIDDEYADRNFKLQTVLAPLKDRRHPLFAFLGNTDPYI